MFDELAPLGLHAGDATERELLWAACMLHDIGMSIDYDDHHKHSRYLILNGGLPGFTPRDRDHRPGRALPPQGHAPPGPLARCSSAESLADWTAVRCYCAWRRTSSARATSWCAPSSSAMVTGERRVELRLIADGDIAVPRWAASREGELFARAFHRDLSVAA